LTPPVIAEENHIYTLQVFRHRSGEEL